MVNTQLSVLAVLFLVSYNIALPSHQRQIIYYVYYNLLLYLYKLFTVLKCCHYKTPTW